MWSLRNIQNFVYNACLYEFEDIIDEVDNADILSPPQYDPLGHFIKRVAVHKTKYTGAFSLTSVNPYVSAIELAYDYDVYFVILDFPWSLSSINLLKNWRRRCRFVVCYIVEIWSAEISQLANFIDFFQDFDLICIGTYHVLENVQELTDCPCIFLPPGVDTLKFYPDPQKDQRSIDLCSLGRRSEVTHNALLALSEQESFFYYYEITNGSVLRIDNHRTHRTRIANLLKSSRYYITNYAKADLPGLIAGEHEIGYRFFEGAAAGNILIGAPPQGDLFKQYFDWENAIIPIDFDEPGIADVIAELNTRPDYLKETQNSNVMNSLLKHDWVYRWEQVLNELELPLTQAMKDRKSHLQDRAIALQPANATRYIPLQK